MIRIWKSKYSKNNSHARTGAGIFVLRRFKKKKKNKDNNNESQNLKENFMVPLTNPMLYDRLHTLSVEYSISVEQLVNVAVKHLLDDVDSVRNLRTGKIELE